MKKIRLFIIPIIALLVTLMGVSYSFATAKPANAVYGVYSEIYPGVSWSGSGDDRIDIYPWEGTVSIINDKSGSTLPDIAAEGEEYMSFKYNSAGWVGFGYTRVGNGTIDMSNYAGGKVKFSARSNNPDQVKNGYVFFQTSTGQRSSESVFLTGLTNNWKEFEFDIPSTGIDLDKVTILFAFVQDSKAPAGETSVLQVGNIIDIDNIRWERADGTFEEIDVTGINFSAELQNGSDNKITWYADGTDISTVENVDWKIANEHINLKITKFLDKDNNEYPIGNGKTVSSYPFSSSSLSKWKFRIYTLGGTKNGLLPYESGNYYDGAEPLPICWRLTDSELSNSETITETVDDEENRHLENSDGWRCWLYIQNIVSDDYNTDDYAIMWNNSKGYRGSEGDYYGGPNGFDVTPKLYIGAKFKNAVGGLEYKSTIVIECYDE